MRRNKRKRLNKTAFRSSLTTGRNLLQDVDGRTAQARRYRDVLSLYTADIGGEHTGLSEGQRALVRRATALTIELERLETTFAQSGGAKPFQFEAYMRGCNSLKRLLETLGIHRGRIARDIETPTLREYINGKRPRRTVIEGEVLR